MAERAAQRRRRSAQSVPAALVPGAQMPARSSAAGLPRYLQLQHLELEALAAEQEAPLRLSVEALLEWLRETQVEAEGLRAGVEAPAETETETETEAETESDAEAETASDTETAVRPEAEALTETDIITEPGTPPAPDQPSAEDVPAEIDELESEAPVEAAAPEPPAAEEEMTAAFEQAPAVAPGAAGPAVEAGTAAELREQLVAQAQAIPAPRVRGGGGAVGSAARRREEEIHFTESGVSESAAELLPPAPEGLETLPVPVEGDPVPAATQLVETSAGHALPEQTFFALHASPLGNQPRLGARPLSAQRLRELMDLDVELVTVPDEAQQELLELRDAMLNPPEVAAEVRGEATLAPHPPRPVPTPTAAARTQLPQVFARLLARPEGEARQLMSLARRAAFPNGALDRVLPDYGDDPHAAELARELETQYRDIAAQSGVAADELDAAVADRRHVLEEEELAAREALASESGDAGTLVCSAHEELSSTVASEAAHVEATTDAVAAHAGGGGGAAQVHAQRDAALRRITRRAAEIDAGYRRAQQDRERELDGHQTQRIDAYRAAVQQDGFQLEQMAALPADRQADLRSLYLQHLQRDPSEEEGLTQVEVNELAAVSTRWGDERAVAVRTLVTEFRQQATSSTSTWREATMSAADQAREQVRAWDEAQSGEVRGWWDALWERVGDWIEQGRANAEAWQAQLNQEHAAEAVADLNLIDRLTRAAERGITAEQEAELNRLSGDQRRIVNAFFEARAAGRSVDPIEMVAELTRTRIWNERRPAIASWLETHFFEDDSVTDAQVGQVVGIDALGLTSSLHRAFHGSGYFGGFSEAGTDEDAVYAALGGLNHWQSLGLRKVYLRRYHVSLESELESELSEGELDRARDLLASNAAAAAAATLYTAMHQTFLGTGGGTDEDTVHATLRGLSAEQRAEVERIYRERYGRELSSELRGELDDWATVGTWEADRAEAELAGDLELADAIEIDHELHGSFFHTSTTETVASVYERVRREVEAQALREQRDSAWMQAEIDRRTAGIERQYNGRYAETSGTLSEAIDSGTRAEAAFWGNTPENREASADYLHALSRNDVAAADAARIRIERTALVYADDDVLTGTVGSQYDRALVAERLDYAPGRRRELRAALDAEEEADLRAGGRAWTAAERWQREQEIERQVQREMTAHARDVAEANLARMETEYEDRYRESASDAILESTSGVSHEMAATQLDQGGYLTPYQTFEYATERINTDEEAAAGAFAGLTEAEIAKLDARWQREHDGQTLRERAASTMSGRELLDVDIALDGAPRTIDDQIEAMRRRVEFERPTSGVGALLAREERAVMEAQLAHLESVATRMHDPPVGSNLAEMRASRAALLDDFEVQNAVLGQSIEHHRQTTDALTDSITTAVGMFVAIVVGTVGSFFTAGAAAAVALAIIASLASTAATIGTRALLRGNAYGWEDLAVDIGVGVVDAVVAGLTAGLGDKLLAAARPAGAAGLRQVTATGLRGAWPRVTGFLGRNAARLGDTGVLTRGVRPVPLLQRMAAREASLLSRGAAVAMAETAENLVQSLPSTVLTVALDDNTWEGPGNPLGRLLSGTAQGLGPGLAMGLAFSGALRGAGRVRGALGQAFAGTRLGIDTHRALPTRLAPDTPEYRARLGEWQGTHPGRPETEFQARMDQEFHAATRAAEAELAVRRDVAAQLEDALPPGDRRLAAEVPVTVVGDVDFRRLNGWRSGDATVVVHDGQVHVVVREGAPPHAVRAQLEAHVERLRNLVEPGTAGRVRDPHAALPRDLRGRLTIEIDPDLPPRTVRVERSPVPHIVAGPGARAADIHGHVETARNMLQLHGSYGRARQLLDRFADWAFLHGEPPVGTRAWEARQELRKLPDIIDARLHEAAQPGLTLRERAALRAEVDHLRAQLDAHARALRAFDLSPGRGYVAAEGYRGQPELRGPRSAAEPDSVAGLRQQHEDWVESVRRGRLDAGALAHLARGEMPAPGRPPWHADIDSAYAAYDTMVQQHGGRHEVGIYRNADTGEYMVVAGGPTHIRVPNEALRIETVLHFHPDYGPTLYRGPSGTDLGNTAALARDTGRPATEFIEYEVPGAGRARTAFTLTPIPDPTVRGGIRMQIDIEYVDPATGQYKHQRFASRREWSEHYGSRTTALDPDGPVYRDLMRAGGLADAEIDLAATRHRPAEAEVPPQHPPAEPGRARNAIVGEPDDAPEVRAGLASDPEPARRAAIEERLSRRGAIEDEVRRLDDKIAAQGRKIREREARGLRNIDAAPDYRARERARQEHNAAMQRARERLRGMENRLRGLLDEHAGLGRQIDRLRGERLWEHHSWRDLGDEHARPCFAAGTPVHTPQGLRAIDALKPGDLVWATDPATLTPVARPVTAVHRGWTRSWVIMQMGGEIRATRRHPVWSSAEERWIEARRLRAGAMLRLRADDAALASVQREYGEFLTWNIEVADLHTYHVGKAGVLVHNGDDQSRWLSTSRRDTIIYAIVERATPTSPERIVYVGKTHQEQGRRFGQHLGSDRGWDPRTHREVVLHRGRWTDFETAVWEQHFITRHGGARSSRADTPLENEFNAITEEAYRAYRRHHHPC